MLQRLPLVPWRGEGSAVLSRLGRQDALCPGREEGDLPSAAQILTDHEDPGGRNDPQDDEEAHDYMYRVQGRFSFLRALGRRHGWLVNHLCRGLRRAYLSRK